MLMMWIININYVVGDSIFNGINEKGLRKKHDIKVKNTPGVTN